MAQSYDSWLMSGFDKNVGDEDELTEEEIEEAKEAENEAKIDAYEERMNRDMTDADQDRLDNARDANDSRMWEGG